jgi:hypothetical protein
MADVKNFVAGMQLAWAVVDNFVDDFVDNFVESGGES